MINFIQPANVVYIKAPRDLKSGQGFVVGELFAICTVDCKAGFHTPGMVEGGVELNLTTGLTKVGGDLINFNETTQAVVASGGKAIGYAIDPPPDHTLAPGTVWVKLVPMVAAA